MYVMSTADAVNTLSCLKGNALKLNTSNHFALEYKKIAGILCRFAATVSVASALLSDRR